MGLHKNVVVKAVKSLAVADSTSTGITYSGTWAAGSHTIKIEYTGTKNASSTGTGINVDAFKYK